MPRSMKSLGILLLLACLLANLCYAAYLFVQTQPPAAPPVAIAPPAAIQATAQAEPAPPHMPKLIIVHAAYGDLPTGDQSDVTVKVSSMVKNNQVSVEATNDNFDDPAVGILKHLRIDYTIDDVRLSQTVDENQTLTIRSAPPRLVIVKAVYGDLPGGVAADVTAKVATMVDTEDHMSIAASNDNFGDPAEGVKKKLRVEYAFDGQDKTRMVDEGETLAISEADH